MVDNAQSEASNEPLTKLKEVWQFIVTYKFLFFAILIAIAAITYGVHMEETYIDITTTYPFIPIFQRLVITNHLLVSIGVGCSIVGFFAAIIFVFLQSNDLKTNLESQTAAINTLTSYDLKTNLESQTAAINTLNSYDLKTNLESQTAAINMLSEQLAGEIYNTLPSTAFNKVQTLFESGDIVRIIYCSPFSLIPLFWQDLGLAQSAAELLFKDEHDEIKKIFIGPRTESVRENFNEASRYILSSSNVEGEMENKKRSDRVKKWREKLNEKITNDEGVDLEATKLEALKEIMYDEYRKFPRFSSILTAIKSEEIDETYDFNDTYTPKTTVYFGGKQFQERSTGIILIELRPTSYTGRRFEAYVFSDPDSMQEVLGEIPNIRSEVPRVLLEPFIYHTRNPLLISALIQNFPEVRRFLVDTNDRKEITHLDPADFS
jgi:hypothetical protein